MEVAPHLFLQVVSLPLKISNKWQIM